MAERNVDVYAARLGDPALELKHKFMIAQELRDAIEFLTQGPMYAPFLKKLMPIILKLLETPPVFISTSWEQRLRNCIFEILNRLPMTPLDALEPYAPDLVDRLMELVQEENEDNAVLCMKTIMNLGRHQVKVLADKVQPFLDLIQTMFQNVDQAVKDTFDNPVLASAVAVPSTPNNAVTFQSPRPGSPPMASAEVGAEQPATRHLLKGIHSFKVLAECPIIVVTLFQAYRDVVPRNIKAFVPLIKDVLMLQAAPQKRAHQEAQEQGRIFTGVSVNIKNRAAFGEFVNAQVKTMNFLAYLLRSNQQQLTDFMQILPDIVVRLLRDCPRERPSARKELFVAIQHIINFNFRRRFLTKIDDLLDEQTLIGDGLTVYETLRPLAYSMLADLIHHVREWLEKDQIRRTIEVYTKNLHDDFPGTTFQTVSAKLLLNLADCIAKLEDKRDDPQDDKKDARHLLLMILDAIGDKFAAMNREFPNAVKISKQNAALTIDAAAPDTYLADRDLQPDWDAIDIFKATPIKLTTPRERGSDPVADNRSLFRHLMKGLKNIFFQLHACNPKTVTAAIDAGNAPTSWKDVSYGYDAEGIQVITKLFREGAHVFRYYRVDKPATESPPVSPVDLLANHYMVTSGPEEKELLETLATVFHCIDLAAFHEVFRSEIPRLYRMTFEHTALLHVPQFFLASSVTSPSFAGMLLQFLMDHIDDVGTSDVKQSSILLRLFKLSFMAVTLFPIQNEQILLPHVAKIVTQSIKLSTTAEEPLNYFLLLRCLFRSIGGGRFELLYKEILPLLEMLLEVLNNLLMAARKPHERELYVELCLTVPARLSNLLPHLSYLMRPLVVALRPGSDLVGQGLRTLELCVDNLTADYLDPIMAPVIEELMTALWDHLRPAPYPHFHSHTTMRILGKLGGRNRKFLNGAPPLAFEAYADDRSSIDVKLIGSAKARAFPVTLGLDLAIARLMETPKTPAAKKGDGYYKQQALRLIMAELKLHIGVDAVPEDFARMIRLQATDLCDGRLDGVTSDDLMEKSERERPIAKKKEQEETLQKLIRACLFAVSVPALSTEAGSLVTGVCRHFTILEIGRALAQAKRLRRSFDVTTGEGPLYLDSRLLAEAIGASLASDVPAVRDAAAAALQTIQETAAALFGCPTKVDRLPFFVHLAKTFCHRCHEEEWFTKAGGSLGIHLFATRIDLGDAWLIDRQYEFVRALTYVIKDMPSDLPTHTRLQARATLELLLRRCNKHVSKSDLAVPTSRLSNLCGFLIYELAHMNQHVRETAQMAFAVIAEVIGAEVHELLAPGKERLLSLIFNKPLRALPFAIQIGYIDAITFCLGLHQEIVEFNGPMDRLLMETLALADADDDNLAAKPNEQRTAEAISQLRVSCIRLLSMAMSFAEFGSSPQNHSRPRIISVFFKLLYSRSPEVSDAANDGLKGVLSITNKLPKDLLQHGLRPILMNLQDPKRLSVAGLEGLARLLTLLTNYFRVEIGARLMDHMNSIADVNSLQKISFTLVEQSPQMKIITAILNVFYLLPPAAITFMEQLVDKVLELEEVLRRTQASPFRAPLIRYLNRYPHETGAFFFGRLHLMRYGRFFAQLLADPSSGPLREVLRQDADAFLRAWGTVEDPSRRDPATISAIHIVHALVHRAETRNWLGTRKESRQQLLTAGSALHRRLRQNLILPQLRLAAEQAGTQLMRIFVNYLAQAPEDLDFLFQVIDAVTAEEIRASDALQHYIYEHILVGGSVDQWRTIVLRCLDLCSSRAASQRTKTFAFHFLVNPIFAMDIMKHPPGAVARTGGAGGGTGGGGVALMDKSMTEAIHNKIWKRHLSDFGEDHGQAGVDHSRMELLQLSALLIKYHHQLISDVRKDIIRFGWTSIRLEDTINKHAAYVVIGYFIAYYECPPKLVIQIYVALLRAHQAQGRSLVTQALELIASVLPKRVAGTGDDPRQLLWAKWPKRILVEESGNLEQLISIFQFLVRHPALFYDAREHFVGALIQNLAKVAPPPKPNPSYEYRKLALNMIGLIWQWEERRVRGTGPAVLRDASASPQTKKRRFEALAAETASPSSKATPSAERAEYIIPSASKLVLVKYLVHHITTMPERCPLPSAMGAKETVVPPSNEMIWKALRQLHGLLSPGYWDDLEIDLFPRVLEPILTSDRKDKADEKGITHIVNALQVVRIIVNARSDEWIATHLPLLQRLLEKPIRMENAEVQECLHGAGVDDADGGRPLQSLIQRVLEAAREEKPEEEEEAETESASTGFVAFLSTIATETLSAGNHLSSINILWTLSRSQPTQMDEHIPGVMKALSSKLARDHVGVLGPTSGPPQASAASKPGETAASGATSDPRETEIQTGLILKTIDIISMRMATLGEQRRPFLSVLASLVEKSQSTPLCLRILELVEGWVFNSTDIYPTLKEKTAVLHKMLAFEARPDSTLLTRFLELVIRIYEDPTITRTELTVRLEHAFLVGTRTQDVEMRNRFMAIFDKSLTRSSGARISYVVTSQNWDSLADSFWINQATQLLFGSIEMHQPAELHREDFTTIPLSRPVAGYVNDPRRDVVLVDDRLEELVGRCRNFSVVLSEVRVRDVLEPLAQLQHLDTKVAHQVWVQLFQMCWSALAKDDRAEMERGMVTMLTKDYHQRQVDKRPNVIQTLLEGAARSKPVFKVPPQVIKYLSRTFDGWYTALHMLEEAAIQPLMDSAAVRESNLDALVELYAGLGEDDLFYGTWRRRCQFVETNAALSYEQNGMWDKAQQMYEAAQIKARTGTIPFSQGEYMIWEDHWVSCAQKLQQWEVLFEYAKHENFSDLLLECAWRQFELWNGPEQKEWLDSIIKGVMDAPTPRRSFFQVFSSLLKLHSKTETALDFTRVCDESVQLSIRKWHQLPRNITNAHIPILQHFQQLVELHDASVICASLSQTNPQNLDSKSQEVKLLLGTWRDRLPNVWDDINAWQDLVTWRQHIFNLINNTYLTLLPQQPSNATGNSYAYRGHHETAWIINRFAHVARKHQLPELCNSQLSRIYTLPNIEIQEAFLKLREQAKCHYQNRNELNSGLDAINNTALVYFGAQQKAEFFTLKGMFLAKLTHRQEANEAFGTALYYDIKLPKAWAEWGHYNDDNFTAHPTERQHAASAVSCYLEAAGLYKSAKSRKLLSRILWLLSLDDAQGTVSTAFETFKGDTPVWYWITFIPQLLTSLSHREARLSRAVLVKIAKIYPQALYFLLRTSREDMLAIKKTQDIKLEKLQRAKQGSPAVKTSSNAMAGADGMTRPSTANGEEATNGVREDKVPTTPRMESVAQGAQPSPQPAMVAVKKFPWEFTEEIMSVLKTAFPLLALSMETMVDQIQKHFKCPPDEDAYRLIVALLNDGLSFVGRQPGSYARDVKLPPATEANITRFAETILPAHIRKSFEADFVTKKPTMHEYIQKLRRWRDKFEEKLDRRPSQQSLEIFSPHLSEFRFQKFDEVEVPGQYLRHRDKNQDFIRIERFLPNVDLVRGIGVCHRRLHIRGHDGSVHPFAIQHPAARHCRREERHLQLFRIFNGVLAKRKESRRRNLIFHLPLMVPLAPHIRLVQDDATYITLQGVFEDHCRRHGTNKDEPVLFTMEKLRVLADLKATTSATSNSRTNASNSGPSAAPTPASAPPPPPDMTAANLKMEAFTAIQETQVPSNIALSYFTATHASFDSFWLFRRRFSYQFASLTFMTYILHMNNRYPLKLSISRSTGACWGSELIPATAAGKPLFHNPEPVPFRLTPNLQVLMGPLALEGIFSCALMALARCLTEPDFDLDANLSIFVRDEMIFWFTQQHRSASQENQLRETVAANTEIVVRKARSLAQPAVGNLPANQTVIDLIARAVDPVKLSQSDALWMPYL